MPLPRPDGHHTITPAFVVPDCKAVISFLERAFAARVVDRYDTPAGGVAHAEIMIDGSVVMCGDASPESPAMPARFSYYVADGPAVDAAYERALAAGATTDRPPADQFYGYRSATVRDVGGNYWSICAVIENVSKEEIDRRMAAMMSGGDD